MKLIMESWRSSPILTEVDSHSNAWLAQITVGQFINTLESDDTLNKDLVQKAVSAATKKYANEIAKLEGEDETRFNSILQRAMSAETVDSIADYGAEIVSGAGAAAGTAAAIAIGGAAALGAPALIAGAALGFAARAIAKRLAKKGIQTALDISGALQDLDVPDQDLEGNPVYNLIDISDNYKKVVVGADGELDKQEAAVLAIGFKQVAQAYQRITNDLDQIDPSTADGLQQQSEFFDKPMSDYMTMTATVAVQKAYGKMLSLSTNVTIAKA